jgi:hypothetical protein
MDTKQEVGLSSKEIGLVPIEALEFVWPVVSQIFEHYPRGLLDYYYTLDDLYAFIETKQFDLWLGVDDQKIELVGLCRALNYEHAKLYEIAWVGGKWSKYQPMAISIIEAYAEAAKCTRVVFKSRVGFVRKMQTFGYSPTHIVCEKEITKKWSN